MDWFEVVQGIMGMYECCKYDSEFIKEGNILTKLVNIVTCWGFVCDLQDEFWILWLDLLTPYTFTTRDYRQFSATADLHTLQFTVAHTLGFSVFTSRFLAMDLSQFHCHFKSHIKSSLHSLTPFLPFLLNHPLLASPELDPILDNYLIKRHFLPFYNLSARTTQKTQPLYFWEGFFTDPLLSNGRPIVGRVCFRGNVFTESLPSNGSIRHCIIF
jgi:hypothetical protein